VLASLLSFVVRITVDLFTRFPIFLVDAYLSMSSLDPIFLVVDVCSYWWAHGE
jgi:hypothetical protein